MSRSFWSLTIIVIVVAALTSSVFIIREGKQALLFEIGHLQVDTSGQPTVLKPGLHVKLPFITQARQFDMRAQLLPINVSIRMDKTGLDGNADYAVYWKIANLPKFYQSTNGSWSQTNTLLTQRLTGHLNLTPGQISNNDLTQQAATLTSDLGIKILAINYKGVTLSKTALNSTYQIMRDNEEQEAKKIRMDGKLQADKIITDAKVQSTITIAQAEADASKSRANGDEQAAKIYADAYSKDPEFYSFLINLEAYSNTFNSKEDLLVLTPNMQFFNYFNQPQTGNNTH